MTSVFIHPTHFVEFLPYYLQLPQNIQLSCAEGNARDNFVSIWDDHKIVFDHPWAIRALKGYAALVFIQRKLKLWLYEKRLLVSSLFCPSALLFCSPSWGTSPRLLQTFILPCLWLRNRASSKSFGELKCSRTILQSKLPSSSDTAVSIRTLFTPPSLGATMKLSPLLPFLGPSQTFLDFRAFPDNHTS